jgi:putrescine transport system permease protein
MNGRARRAPSEWIVLLLPYAWMLVFFLAPFAIVAKLSFSQAALAQPPYMPVFEWGEGLADLWEKLGQLTGAAYGQLADDGLYLAAYASSLKLAGIATLLTLLIAYPMAYGISRVRPSLRPALVLLAVAPFWTSFLIRVYAWITILKDEGLLNTALRSLGLIDEPLHIFATDWAVLIGITYSYLPFMVLPIYNAIAKQDPTLLEAAADLGAGPLARFWRITFPLSTPGIFAGCLLVFIPAIGEFVIPDLLGGSDTLMIGRTIWTDFFENRDWPTASAAAVVLLILLLIPMSLYERLRHRDEQS